MRKTAVKIFAFFLGWGVSVQAADFHVSKKGSDANKGTMESPFFTINRAVQSAMPGDVVIVHEGTYREEVTPVRGGTSDKNRIVFKAAPNEIVEIKGSEVVKDWERVKDNVWKVVIPNAFFGDFNPYGTLVTGDWFEPKGRKHHAGCVYLNNVSLFEAASLEDLYKKDIHTGERKLNCWFAEVNETTTTIFAQFPGVNPNVELVEINKRETVFYPRKPFINYITVSGFIMSQAAPKWGPPTAEQMGLIGTHWSKGWIIENNKISNSINVGISLGKYGDEFDNLAPTAEAYLSSIDRALKNGWNKETIGGHIVRNNEVSFCEQAGINGSMGACFSQIIGNHVHHIHNQRRFDGAEMAGIKFHAPIDVLIKGNRIHNAPLGLWLDWMTQGTRVTGNVIYHNGGDMFIEVNHGPAVFDNNIFGSGAIDNRSQGMAFINNLFLGEFCAWLDLERATPYFKAHSTEKIADHLIDMCDTYAYNNIFVGNGTAGPTEGAQNWLKVWRGFGHTLYKAFGLWVYDPMPVAPETGGNVYLHGARPYKKEKALVDAFNPAIEIVEAGERVYLKMNVNDKMMANKVRKITSKTLGTTPVSKAAFEDYDGRFLIIDKDYNGLERSNKNVLAGPFENLVEGENVIKLW